MQSPGLSALADGPGLYRGNNTTGDQAQRIHDTWPTATAALVVLPGQPLWPRWDPNRLTLQVVGDGPVGRIWLWRMGRVMSRRIAPCDLT